MVAGLEWPAPPVLHDQGSGNSLFPAPRGLLGADLFTAGNRGLSNRRLAPSTELRRCRSAFLQPESLPGGHKTRPMDSLPEPTRSGFANGLHAGRLPIFAKEVFPHLAAVFVAG